MRDHNKKGRTITRSLIWAVWVAQNEGHVLGAVQSAKSAEPTVIIAEARGCYPHRQASYDNSMTIGKQKNPPPETVHADNPVSLRLGFRHEA